MIVAVGATGALGTLGGRTVEALLAQPSADQVDASVRDPSKTASPLERGMRAHTGDCAEPNSLATNIGMSAISLRRLFKAVTASARSPIGST